MGETQQMKTQENEVVLVEFSPMAKVSKTIKTRINEGNVNLQGQKEIYT